MAIDGSQIVSVGSREEIAGRWPDARVEDFGEAAILPGLINTHSHLELTVMRGLLEAEDRDFFAWLKKLTIARNSAPHVKIVSRYNGGPNITNGRRWINCPW